MSPQRKDVDVIVVGAGLSGLRAAVDVHRAGLSVLVLESNTRVGGRTLSVNASANGSGKVELGAAWINDTSQSEMYSLAHEFGFELIKQRITGDVLHQDADGSVKELPHGEMPLDDATKETLLRCIGMLNEETFNVHPELPHKSSGAASLDNMTFLAYVRQVMGGNPYLADALANQLSSALFGVGADECSALYVLGYLQSGTGFANLTSDEKHGGQYLRNRQGNQSFSVRLAALLPPGDVLLSTPVSRISQQGSSQRVIVESVLRKQSWTAKRVIISIPSPNWASIDFVPPLPPSSVSVARNTALGYYSKMILVYSSPWWREADLSGVLSAPQGNGPISFSRDTCSEADGQFSLTCFLVGQQGREWSKWPAAERQRQVMGQVDATFGESARRKKVKVLEPINIIEVEWMKDPSAKGGPASVMWPGTLTAKVPATLVIREPVGKVHFVGTDTSTVWKGYMEGAVRSGIRGAEEVVRTLKGSARARL